MLCRHKAFTASTRKRILCDHKPLLSPSEECSVATKPLQPRPGKEYTLSPQSVHCLHPEKNMLCRHKTFTASTRKRIYSVATKPSPLPPGKEYTLSPQSLHRHHPEKNILCHHKAFTASTRKRTYSVTTKPLPLPPGKEYTLSS